MRPTRSIRHLAVVVSSFTLIGVFFHSPAPAQPAGSSGAEAREKLLKINYIFNRKLYSLAIPEYERFLAEHADFDDIALVHYALAMCHYNVATSASAPAENTAAGTRVAAIEATAGRRREGSLRTAMSHLKQALRARGFASRTEAMLLLGRCLVELREYDDALKTFGWVTENGRSEEHKAAATLAAAETLYRQERHSEAAAAYRRFLAAPAASNESSSRARFYLAMALYNSAERDEIPAASEIFTALARAREDPYREDAQYMAALILSEQGDDGGAARLFGDLVQSGSKSYAELALFGLGSSRFGRGDYREAERVLERFVSGFPASERSEDAQLLLARAQLELGQAAVALQALKKLASSPRVGDQASLVLARQLATQGDGGAALQVTTRALESFPESPLIEALELELALSEIASQRFAAAAGTLDAFRKRHPDARASDHVTYLLAYALYRSGEAGRSLATCHEFRAAYPASGYLPEVLQLEAESAFEVGDYAAARRAYAERLEGSKLDQKSRARMQLRIAQALYQEGDYRRAIDALERQGAPSDAGVDPVSLSYYYYLGDCAYQLSDYARASEEFARYLERIAASEPESRRAVSSQTVDARFKLGHSLQLAGAAEDARKAYGIALQSDPRGPHRGQIYFELGQLEYAAGELREAERRFEQVVGEHRQSPFAPHARFYLGSIAFDRKDYERAIHHFEAVLGAAGSIAADAAHRLALSLLAAGNTERARAVREEFSRQHADDPRLAALLLEEATALTRAGRSEDALAILAGLDNGRATAAERARALYEKAWCLRNLSRPDEAIQTYELLLQTLAESPAPKGDEATLDAGFKNAVRLELAEMEFDRGDYRKARNLLTPLIRSATGETLESALYRLCWCYHKLAEGQPLLDTFTRFETGFPRSDLYPEVGLLAAKELVARSEPTRAAGIFKAIVDGFPRSDGVAAALVSYGECRLEERKFAAARRVFEDFLKRFPDADGTYRAQFGLGWADENLGRRDEAMRHYRAVISSTGAATAARAQFQIGQCYVAAKDYARAIVEFLKVPAAYRYEEWNAKALLQVAGCFEAVDDRQRAEEYYREVATTFPESDEGKLARERLRKLEID